MPYTLTPHITAYSTAIYFITHFYQVFFLGFPFVDFNKIEASFHTLCPLSYLLIESEQGHTYTE